MCISNHNKKEWNLVVLTIISSLDYEEWILHKILNTESINLNLKNRLIKKLTLNN